MNHENGDVLQNQNPYRSPGWQQPAEPTSDGDRLLRWYRRLAVIQCLAIIIGVVAAFQLIESIIATGSILTSVGAVITVLSVKSSFLRGAIFSVSGPAISIFCLLLILTNGWSPAEARDPVSTIAAVYSIIFVPLGLVTVFRLPPAHANDVVHTSSF